MSKIKVFGERNTNTNYFSKLISLNLNVEEVPGVVPGWVRGAQAKVVGDEWLRDFYFALTYNQNLGWKHSQMAAATDLANHPLVLGGVGVVTFTKNPYSWLLSLYNRPYHGPKLHDSFYSFLRSEWILTRRDRCSLNKLNPMEIWNLKNGSYLSALQVGGLNLNSESLFVSGEEVVNKIASHFSFSKKQDVFINFEQSTKERGKDSRYYRDYYLGEQWRGEIDERSFELINQYIDKSLVRHYGYTLIE